LGRAAALAAGLAAAFAHPPFGLLPGLLGYAALLRLLDQADPARPLRSAFLRGWLAGLGYFAVSTWWVAEAFFVDAAEQGWMAPFAVVLMAAGLALFWGTAGALYRGLAPRGAWRVLAFAGALGGCEWLRGHLFTGFPWDLPGETWAAGTPVSEAASVVGAYGLTWITLAIAAAPGLGLRARGARIALGAALAALGGLYGFGAWRLAGAATSPMAGAPMVRIVQPDTPEQAHYDAVSIADVLHRNLVLTAQPAARTPDVVIWSEAGVPDALDDYLAPGTWSRAAVVAALKPGQMLITGGYREVSGPGGPIYFNSLLAVRRTGDDLAGAALYDKHRLAPFGEYLPLDSVLAALGIKQLIHVGAGFTPGPPPRPIVPSGLPPAQPLICYESLFPGFTRAGARASGVRAAWIINLSDDAWFGRTSGPWQHLNLASYRAIEEGLPMVRATPTGVSAMIDAYGRVVPGKRLGQGDYGVIDAALPPPAAPTLFDRWGGAPFLSMILFSLAARSRGGLATMRRDRAA
jgi:apolipoprotein N-acyltransferase